MYPYREDGVKSAIMAIRNIKAIWKLCDRIDKRELAKAQETMDAIETQEVVRKSMY